MTNEDKFGNPLGYWPDETGYGQNQPVGEKAYTDPLDPNDYNPSERRSSSDANSIIANIDLM